MAAGKAFLDTNVLVYAQDDDTPEKRTRSRDLIADVIATGIGVVSTQVLQEFFVASTRKLGVPPLAAKAVVQSFRVFEVVHVSPDLIEHAIDRSVLSQISFWDALIVSASIASGCVTIYSEDLNAGQPIDGVRIVNPFA
jgi:predicted nucleic acid-binding protein